MLYKYLRFCYNRDSLIETIISNNRRRMFYMNKQKWLAGLTAAVCCTSVLFCFPAISGTVSAAELVSNDFEVNYGGWYGNADAVA